MNEFIQKVKSFFLDLQEKDDRTKKQWLIGLTSASMLVVLGLWIISINSTIEKLEGSGSSKNETSSGGFAATISQGFKVMTGKIGSSLSEASDKIQDYIGTTNSVTIQPTNINFSNNIEPISPKKFP